MARFRRALAPGHAERGRFARGTRRATRCAVVLLALGLGVNGIALCLCIAGPATAGSARAHDPHACCPKQGSRHEGMPATGACINAPPSCCGSQTVAPSFVARIEARDVLRDTLATPALTYVVQESPFAPSTFRPAMPARRDTSPPLTTVLRI